MGKGFYSTDGSESTLEPMIDPEEQKKIDSEKKTSAPKVELDRAGSYSIEMPKKSTESLYVYLYDLELNRFKPYNMDGLKKSEDFPNPELNKMLNELAEHGRPPKMDRILWGLGFSVAITVLYIIFVQVFLVITKNTTAKILLWTISIAPVALTCVMVLVACVGYMSLLGRRNSLGLTIELRNRESFNKIGLNVVFSQTYEWFCIEIRNKKILAETMNLSMKNRAANGEEDSARTTAIMDSIKDDKFDF
jgi:hypothetical protein